MMLIKVVQQETFYSNGFNRCFFRRTKLEDGHIIWENYNQYGTFRTISSSNHTTILELEAEYKKRSDISDN